MLTEALRYSKIGWSIIPVAPKSKEPLILWKEFQTRRASETEIQSWFVTWPDANIGIVTGAVSQLVVIDLDGITGFASAATLKLHSTAISITGRGKHLWYKHPGGTVQNSVRKYPGIDIRGDGGFVLAPPSVHPNGRRYRWVGPVTTAEKMTPFPSAAFAGSAPDSSPAVKRNEPGWIAKALEDMTDGNIDDTLFRICSRFRSDGYTASDVYKILLPHAERVGADDGHLQAKIDNVWARYTVRPRVARSGGLVLHSPDNLDSINEYHNRTAEATTDLGYATGYPRFDAVTKGLKRGEVLTVAARTGVGKTNWIITAIRTFCENHKRVLLFSTEMSFDQIWQRYLATLVSPTDFNKHSLYICDEFTPDVARIEEAIRHVQPDLFVFDHISHIGTDYHIISRFMSEVKRLCRLFNIPAIVTAQLNRNADWVEGGERVEPRMSMIQGSGTIEQISGAVLLLAEKRVNGDYTEIDGIIDKNRHGDKGLIKFGLFSKPFYQMKELE